MMDSLLQFKYTVEKQYKEGFDKMARLYQIDGEPRLKLETEAKRIESSQKIRLLGQALDRYKRLHVVDIESDGADGA